jgi:hypothetical protein
MVETCKTYWTYLKWIQNFDCNPEERKPQTIFERTVCKSFRNLVIICEDNSLNFRYRGVLVLISLYKWKCYFSVLSQQPFLTYVTSYENISLCNFLEWHQKLKMYGNHCNGHVSSCLVHEASLRMDNLGVWMNVYPLISHHVRIEQYFSAARDNATLFGVRETTKYDAPRGWWHLHLAVP